jgi:predicted transcriptional regulator
MANTKLRPWTEEDVRTLKTLAHEKTKTIVIARKLKRTIAATYNKVRALGVSVGIPRKRKATR